MFKQWGTRSQQRLERLGLRPRLLLTMGLLAVLITLGTGLVAQQQQRAVLTQELRARLLVDARSLAQAGSEALATPYPELILHPLIRQMQAEDPALVYAVVVDQAGVVQGHSEPSRLGERYAPPERVTPLGGVSALRPGESVARGERLILVETPVLSASGERIGRVVAGMERSTIARRARSGLALTLLAFAGLLGLGLGVLVLLTPRVLAPLGRLRDGLVRIGRGNYEIQLASERCPDFAQLVESFNTMSHRLLERRVQLEQAGKPEPSAAEAEALRLYSRAQKEGKRLALPANHEAMGELRGWVRALLEGAGLADAQVARLLESVHATAAALAEQACGLDAKQRIELWWLGPAPGDGARSGGPRDGEDCCFLLREQGKAAKPQKNYAPGTEAGNLTIIPVILAPQPTSAGRR
ncbi:HAMP domain-containing protein [bacterium]|nr:HAMP domain-containing protein [bacterium]